MPLTVEIITPEKVAFRGEADACYLPTTEGEIGILPGHLPLLAEIEPGEVRVEKGGSREFLAIDKGHVQVRGDKLSILTEAAIDVEAIDLSKVEEARQRAAQALEEAQKEGKDPAEIEELETVVRFAIAQRLVRQRQGR